MSKLVLILSLIILSIIDLITAGRYSGDDSAEVYTVHYVTPAIKLATFVSSNYIILVYQPLSPMQGLSCQNTRHVKALSYQRRP